MYRRFLVNEFDVIHFNITPTWTNGTRMLLKLARLRGTPTILNLHGMIPIEHEFYRYEYSRSRLHLSSGTHFLWMILDCCRDVDRIVVNSNSMRADVMDLYGIDDDKIVVIPNGVDLDRFSKCDSRFLLDGDPVILYVGMLSRMKGIPILIEAIDRLRSVLPNVKLHLVGDGFPRSMEYFKFLLKNRRLL